MKVFTQIQSRGLLGSDWWCIGWWNLSGKGFDPVGR